MARAIGIDLGSYSVKVAELDRKVGKYVVTTLHDVRVDDLPEPPRVPEPGEEAGPPQDPLVKSYERGQALEARIACLRRILDEHSLGAVPSAMAFPAEAASIRVLALPFADRGQVVRALPFEIENHVPFEVDDMILEHRVVVSEPGRSLVLALLMERDRVEALVSDLAANQVDPRSLAVDADILATWGSGTGTQVVLDMGHSRTLVTLVHRGQAAAIRAVDLGGRDLTLRLARTFGMTWDVAEAWKHALRVGEEPAPMNGIDVKPLVRCLEEGLTEILAEVRSSLMGMEDQYEADVDEILLTGGTSRLGGISVVVARELGVPVRPAPMESLFTEGEPGAHAALVCALGLRVAGELKGKPLELRKGTLAHRGRFDVFWSLGAWAAAAVALFFLSSILGFGVSHHRLAKATRALEEQIVQEVVSTFPTLNASVFTDASKSVAIMQEMTTEVTTKADVLGAIYKGEPPTLDLIRDLSEAMPSATDAPIDVRELNIAENALNFKAETTGYEQAAKIEASLQADARFKTATKGDEKKVGEKVQFTLTIPFGEAEAALDESPKANGKATEKAPGTEEENP